MTVHLFFGTVFGVTATFQDPYVALSVSLARADLSYVHGALMRDNDPTARWVFLQYAVMVSFEARRYVERELQIPAPEALWPEDMASAARTSGKYFDDNRRFLTGVVSYFDELIEANRATFYPEYRRAKWLDWMRRDLAVLLLDGVPVATNISGYFSAGLSPAQLLDRAHLGAQIHDLAAGVGQTIAWLQAGQGHRGPLDFEFDRFEWRDAKAAEALRQVFGGDLQPPVAAAMMTVQSAASGAQRLAQTTCCAQCVTAAFKHRLIVAYQSSVALRHVLQSPRAVSPEGKALLATALSDPACVHLLGAGYRKLRNGLLHLGLTDVPTPHDSQLTMADVICHYTGAQSPEEVVTTVDQALGVVTRSLEAWCLTAPPDGPGLSRVLYRP